MLAPISVSIIAILHALVATAAVTGPAELAPRQDGDNACEVVCAPADPDDPDLITYEPVPCDATCNSFYECTRGTPVQIQCPPNLVFNPERGTCDFSWDYECPPVPECCGA